MGNRLIHLKRRTLALLFGALLFFFTFQTHTAPSNCVESLQFVETNADESISIALQNETSELLSLSTELNRFDDSRVADELQISRFQQIENKVLKSFSNLKKWNLTFQQYWTNHPRVSIKSQSWTDKIKKTLRVIYNYPVRGIIPFPLPRWSPATDLIFEKKYKNSTYQPTKAEWALLKNQGLDQLFNQQDQFQKKHPLIRKLKKSLGALIIAIQIANVALIGNWALHLEKPETFVTGTAFLNEPQYQLKSNQVRLFNESVPFPHMAIEIDGQVYSYGQTHMSISASRDYLMSEEIQKLFAKPETGEGTIHQDNNWLQLDKVMAFTGLNKQPRSVQTVTLNLDPEQKQSLKRFLALSQFHAYRNQTLVMDCSSMVTLALQRKTDIPLPLVKGLGLDASPSMMMMYFGAVKSMGEKNNLGQPIVDDIHQVAMGATDQKELHYWRNIYINAMESKIFWAFLPIDMGFRSYMNLRYEVDQFQYLQPEIRSEIEGWMKSVAMELERPDTENSDGQQLQIILSKAQALQKVSLANRDASWQDEWDNLLLGANYFFNREIAASHDTATSPDASFAEIARHSYREQILTYYRQSINRDTVTSPSNSAGSDSIDPAALLEDILKSRYLEFQTK